MSLLILTDHPTTTETWHQSSWVFCTVNTEEDLMNSSLVVLRTNVEVSELMITIFIFSEIWMGKANWQVNSVVPHGVAYSEYKTATASEVPQMQISKGAIAIMFESSRPFTISEYAWKSDKLHEHDPKMWDNLVGKSYSSIISPFEESVDCNWRMAFVF